MHFPQSPVCVRKRNIEAFRKEVFENECTGASKQRGCELEFMRLSIFGNQLDKNHKNLTNHYKYSISDVEKRCMNSTASVAWLGEENSIRK